MSIDKYIYIYISLILISYWYYIKIYFIRSWISSKSWHSWNLMSQFWHKSNWLLRWSAVKSGWIRTPRAWRISCFSTWNYQGQPHVGHVSAENLVWFLRFPGGAMAPSFEKSQCISCTLVAKIGHTILGWPTADEDWHRNFSHKVT